MLGNVQEIKREYQTRREKDQTDPIFFIKLENRLLPSKGNMGLLLKKCIKLFHSSTSTGPIYVCYCCHQTWFSESMTKVECQKSNVAFEPGILTGMKSVQDKEWICRTCLSNIKKTKYRKCLH